MSVVIDVWRGNVKAYPNEHNNIPDIIDNSGGLIAHAGGGINGLKYTNSLEAMEKSIEHGFKMIELDLLISSDGRIVAVHDWKSFHVMTDSKAKSSITYNEFAIKKIYGEYTTLSIEQINKILNESNVFLVTDKIQDLDLLSQHIMNKDRTIVEVFNIDKYNEAIKLGFNNVALNISVSSPFIIEWLSLNEIKAVTYRGDKLNNYGSEYENAIKIGNEGISSLIYSKEDLDLGNIRSYGLKSFALYVDFVIPE